MLISGVSANTIADFGNGDLSTVEPYCAATHHVFQGRALVAIRSAQESGGIDLLANADGLGGVEITIQAISAETEKPPR